jgi:hypothetical protein
MLNLKELVVTVRRSMDRRQQSEINSSLQPWLDLAALLPFKSKAPPPWLADVETVERVFREGAAPESDDINPGSMRFSKFPADELFRNRLVTEGGGSADSGTRMGNMWTGPASSLISNWTAAAEVFYCLFFNVRLALQTIAVQGAHQKSKSERGLRLLNYRIHLPFFGFPQTLAIGSDGTAEICDEPVWLCFRETIKRVESQRLRRCPECARVYYAVRFNKQACDAHLAVAAVKRAQKKRSEYENNRKADRLVKREGLSIGKALEQARETKRRKRIRNDGQGI